MGGQKTEDALYTREHGRYSRAVLTVLSIHYPRLRPVITGSVYRA